MIRRYKIGDELNAMEGVTPPQLSAMHAGSMFGWHVPAANPDNYDAAGNLVPGRIVLPLD